MNIIEFWKEKESKCTNFDFDATDFRNALDENVPDWKEQIRDKSIWPELHSNCSFINACIYTEVIIEELGYEFACYLMENPENTHGLDTYCALTYCAKHIQTDWTNYPEKVQNNLLDNNLKDFFRACNTNSNLWQLLSDVQKQNVIQTAANAEKNYVSDLLLLNLWQNELNFRKSPYLVFETQLFKDLARKIVSARQNNRRELNRLDSLLRRWEFPQINLLMNNLNYTPSEKISDLRHVIHAANDSNAESYLEKEVDSIRNKISWSNMHI